MTDELKQAFDATFDILDAAIESFSAEQWAAGSAPYDGPGRVSAHALQCAVFYTCRDRSAFEGFGMPVHEMTDADVPTQADVLSLSAEARAKTAAWIDSTAAENSGPVLYALRHLQHHVGELCVYQKHAGLEPAEWK